MFSHPYIEAWYGRARSGTDIAASYLGSLAAATAMRLGLAADLTLLCAGPDLYLPGIGSARNVGPGAINLTGHGEDWALTGPVNRLEVRPPFIDDAASWSPVHRLTLSNGGEALTLTI